jgi:hypothetical protein
MDHGQLTRRRFLVSAIVLCGAAGVALPAGVLTTTRAWAASPDQADEPARSAMVRMARLLYPHDALADDVYAEILDRVLSDAASGADFAAQLDSAAAALDAKTNGNWYEADEPRQVEAMRGLQNEPFFIAIQNEVRAGIYNGRAFWKHIGYLGPSKGFGGYLGRGAGDIDWLPGDK